MTPIEPDPRAGAAARRTVAQLAELEWLELLAPEFLVAVPGRARVRVEVSRPLANHNGDLSGGVLLSLCELTAGCAILTGREDVLGVGYLVTAEIHIRYHHRLVGAAVAECETPPERLPTVSDPQLDRTVSVTVYGEGGRACTEADVRLVVRPRR